MPKRASVLSVIVALTLLSAGCEAEPDDEFEVRGEPLGTEEAVAPATPGAVEPPPEVVSYAVPMQPLGGSGISGEATLERDAAGTQVRVQLSGTPGGTSHPGHIHEGASCESPGSVVTPLTPIPTNEQGTGEMITTVELEPRQIMDGNHLIVYHEAEGDPGQPVVCGEIPPLP